MNALEFIAQTVGRAIDHDYVHSADGRGFNESVIGMLEKIAERATQAGVRMELYFRPNDDPSGIPKDGTHIALRVTPKLRAFYVMIGSNMRSITLRDPRNFELTAMDAIANEDKFIVTVMISGGLAQPIIDTNLARKLEAADGGTVDVGGEIMEMLHPEKDRAIHALGIQIDKALDDRNEEAFYELTDKLLAIKA